jgi:hypothetical protein
MLRAYLRTTIACIALGAATGQPATAQTSVTAQSHQIAPGASAGNLEGAACQANAKMISGACHPFYNDQVPIINQFPNITGNTWRCGFRNNTGATRTVWVYTLCAEPGPVTTGVRLVNMIPASLSSETNQDSEPFLAVDRGDPSRIVGSAFTPNPNAGETGRAPVYITEDAGNTWVLRTIVPSDGMTSDITLAGSLRLKRLHSGILKRPGGLLLNILRADDFLSSNLMTVQVSRSNVDQPFVQANRTGNADRVYVGSNDFGLGAQSAAVDVSIDDGATYTRVPIEPRNTAGQNGPSIRPAVSTRDDTVYVAYFGWRSFTGSVATSDIVVVRDDRGATGATRFQDLKDPSDSKPGRIVASGVTIPWSNAPTLGFERIGSTLSIATDPTNSSIVYVAWADRVGDGDIYSIHIRRSTDRGVTWSGDLRRIRNATPFALSIANNGTVGLLFQEYVGSGTGSRWRTHLLQTRDGFSNVTDTVLADVPGDSPPRQFLPYIGDYNFILAVGNEFRGIFSTNNAPIRANFPAVQPVYQRRADFTTGRLLDAAGNTVNVSIDPFYFAVPAIN